VGRRAGQAPARIRATRIATQKRASPMDGCGSAVTCIGVEYNASIVQLLDTKTMSEAQIAAILSQRSDDISAPVENAVREIIAAVRAEGDEAVARLTRRFDWGGATAENLEVPADVVARASDSLPPDDFDMLSACAANIGEFHSREARHIKEWKIFRPDGSMVGQVIRAVNRVGIYAPGGTAAYPSTVLMTAIPALVAGVDEIVLCSPPDDQGHLPDLVLSAAHCRASKVFRVGGAQAIAAMAYGTQTIPKVDLIVGPGNAYVNVAKRLIYGQAGIDMLAGPSEVAVVADCTADAGMIASDLLAQIEHGPENRGFLFTDDFSMLNDVLAEIELQTKVLSRKEILDVTINNIVVVKTESVDQSIVLANILAPEHLHLVVSNAEDALSKVTTAGAVLVGKYSAASIGDYFAGPSHTLPTAGAARFSSALSVSTFVRRMNVIDYSRAGAAAASPTVARFALAEGFDAHAAAATRRHSN